MRGRSIAGLTIGAGAALAAAWILVAGRVAREVVLPRWRKVEDVSIVAVDRAAGTIALTRTPDSLLEGRYTLFFEHDSGHLVVGEILRVEEDRVLRTLERIDYGEPRAGAPARLSGWLHVGPETVGVPVRSIAIEVENGTAPAWLFPADPEAGPEADGGADWAILVHGRGVQRQETLRAVPLLHDEGFTVLCASWRNDGDAPPSPDGRYALGLREWRDIEAALDHAVAHGARRILIGGWSMGGAIALQLADRSRHAGLIIGLLLDSPVVDWRETLEFQADLAGLPDPLRATAERILGAATGGVLTGLVEPVLLDQLDWVGRAEELAVPVLILHSDDDGFVPSGASRALALRRPDLVEFVPFRDARHVKLWNHRPEEVERAIRGWLGRLER